MPRGRVIHWCEGSWDFARVAVTSAGNNSFMNQQNIFGYILVCMHMYSYICTISVIITSCNFCVHRWKWPGNLGADLQVSCCQGLTWESEQRFWEFWVSKTFKGIQQHPVKPSTLGIESGNRSFQWAPLRIHLQLTLPEIDAWKTSLYAWGRPIFKRERFVLGSVGTWLHSKHVFIFFIFAPIIIADQKNVMKYMGIIGPRLALLGGARSVDLAVHQSLSLPGARSRGFKWL